MIGVDINIKNNKLLKMNLFNNGNKIIKRKSKDISFFLIGNIFENQELIINDILYKIRKNKFRELADFNGEYFIFIKHKKKFIFINSRNSYIPIFYLFSNKKLYFKSNVLSFEKNYYQSLNYKKIIEWFLFNGRSFNNKTFLKKIFVLDPGQICIFHSNKLKLQNCKTFNFQKSNLSLNNSVEIIFENLRKAINLRIGYFKKKISFSLSGGLDSRILLSLIDEDKKRFIKTHTFGAKNNFEGMVAKKISKYLRFYHKFYEIKYSDYYKYANHSVANGSFNSIFKNGVKIKYFKNIKNFDRSNFFMMGNALDVLIASSFSNKSLLKIKNLTSFLNWYKKKYILFHPNEIKKIFKKNVLISNNHTDLTLKRFIKKITYNNNFVNLNDALTFETRIKRWHNFGLALQSRISNFIIPTYDKYFLNSCSLIQSKYRIGNLFRKKLLKKINPDLLNIITSNDLEKNRKNEARFFDSNLGLDIKKNLQFTDLYNETKKKIINSNFKNFLNFDYIESIIISHKNGEKDNSRKIFMILTFMIILLQINRKNV